MLIRVPDEYEQDLREAITECKKHQWCDSSCSAYEYGECKASIGIEDMYLWEIVEDETNKC